jgi:uncharacterized membrane protein YfcA
MPESWLLIVAALSLGALVKGATGMGLPLISLPVLATVFGLPRAASILIVPVIVTNLWQIRQTREHRAGTGFLTPMLTAGALGLGVGTFLLATLPQRPLMLTLGLVLAAYIALRFMRPIAPLGQSLGRRLAPIFGFLAGAMQGATGLAAPVGVPFIHAMRLPREQHVFAVSTMFLMFAMAQFFALWIAQLLDWQALLEGILALVPVGLVMPLGTLLGRLLSRAAFDRAILVLLGVIAANLIISSV